MNRPNYIFCYINIRFIYISSNMKPTRVKPTGITASSLKKMSKRSMFDGIIRDIIRMIDSKIYTAHDAGFNQIEHDLPTNFSINNLDKSDAQILVYSEVIKTYTLPEDEGGKGFPDTTITLTATRSIIKIRWHNGMDKADRISRTNLIKKYTS